MLKNPARYLTSRHAERRSTPSDLPVGRLVEGLRQGGWADLNNARAVVAMGDHDIELVGVDDPHIGYDRYDRVSAPAAPGAALTIGLVHAPYQRVLDAMVADGARLVLAGHTHGGQLGVPGWGALVTNCDLDTRRAKGVSRWWPGAGRTGPGGSAAPSSQAPSGAAWLHVSAGLGTSPYAPVRFACRPEATLLTLVAATADRRRPASGARRAGRAISAVRGRSAILGCRRAPGSAARPRGVAQLGSARRSGRRGRRFKSCHPDSSTAARRQPGRCRLSPAGRIPHQGWLLPWPRVAATGHWPSLAVRRPWTRRVRRPRG